MKSYSKCSAISEPADIGRGRINDRLQIIQALFVADLTCTVNRVSTEFVFPFQVIDFRARELFPLNIEKEEQTQFAGLISRIGHHRRAVHRHVDTTIAVNHFEIDSYTRSYLKLITYPKAP